MKLRTTVQLSGAITSTNQKPKPALKREDSFLKRFSTRQIPETQETVDTGDDTETANGPQTHNEVTRRRRKRRKELSKTVVNPDENFYFYWLMTVTVCVLYNLWTLIVRQSFPELQKAASAFWYTGDGFTDLVFVCDIVVQFRTGYLEQGLMVYDSKKLATHYLKSRAFLLDMLSLLPLDFIQFNVGVNPILRFPRFLKIYRIYNYYYMVESRTVYPNLWRVVNLIHILLILAHWFGCFYYLLSEAEGFQGDWVYPYRQGDYATLTRKYLGSLYWSTLTLTTIGDLPTPETNAESLGSSKAMTSSRDPHSVPRRGHKSRLLQFNSNYGYLFTIISYLIGVFIFATIVGQVGNVITNRNANRLEFERLLDGAKTYMRHHKVPGGMKRRVLRWYDYSWSRGRIQGGGDINTALGLLPDKLKTELALHVNLSVLKKVTIFQECQPEFLHDLVLKMKAYIFTPGDLICRKGEVAREMFIIADGILDVISETGRVLTTMKAGDFFGEIGILNLDGLNKRTADVRSVGYSELFSLSREDVLTAMKDYPEAQEILQNLGRKRLMEAKNASKMHKIQAKQTKDCHDSSGDSDTAGKRIVEKLRSDVKGLKNALRRSRRGTRTKDELDEYSDTRHCKTPAKKQSILRRMSHVQSSDEFEGSNEILPSPIGAGFPLLQRLKCLKEKQEREKEEKEKLKLSLHSLCTKEEDPAEPEVIGAGLPLTQRLKLLKQKEEKEAAAAAAAANTITTSAAAGTTTPNSSTVRTQLTGMRFDKSLVKTNTTVVTSPKSEDAVTNVNTEKDDVLTSSAVKELSSEVKKLSLIDKFKIGVKDKNMKNFNESELPSNLNPTPENTTETSNNVPVISEEENSVPKLLGSKFEVPKIKDGWELLKKSSLTGSRWNKSNKAYDKSSVRKISKKGTYLSKSDTVLEKQKTFEKEDTEEKKCSRPLPSTEESDFKDTSTPCNSDREKEKSLDSNSDVESDRDRRSIHEKLKIYHLSSDDSGSIKKYNSISDLSPEYSGLPFVKKLKILNERQKLAELEKELVVRSASLDVPDHQTSKIENILIRSQSEASTVGIICEKNVSSRLAANGNWKQVVPLTSIRGKTTKFSEEMKLRELNQSGRENSEESVVSPENNETLERRHLKSILKKLSNEESISDEDQFNKGEFKKKEKIDMKKLLRAPTIEGYAARHKKLTKSVTFDSDTLPSSAESLNHEFNSLDESKIKGFSPLSPTAILTLQLSNLSMIPIVGPKNTGKKDIEEKLCEEKIAPIREKHEVESVILKVLEKLQEEIQKMIQAESEKENAVVLYPIQELDDKSAEFLPLLKTLDDELLAELIIKVQQIIQGVVVEIQNKFQSQFSWLETEVKKRDETIQELQSKLQKLEENKAIINRYSKTYELDIDTDGCEEECDSSSDAPFLRGDSFETILSLSSSDREPHFSSISSFGFPISANDVASNDDNNDNGDGTYQNNSLSNNDSNNSFIVNNESSYSEINHSLKDCDSNEMKKKINLLPKSNDYSIKMSRFRDSLNSTGQNLELRDFSKLSNSDEIKGKRNKLEMQMRRNFSVDETQLQATLKPQRRWSTASKSKEEKTKLENRSKKRLIDRMPGFQRSFSCSHEKEFIALNIDDDSTSSDAEQPNNKDWEIQMLVKEWEKKESLNQGHNWLEDDWMSDPDEKVKFDDVKRLQDEVNTLKHMVCESDLTRLTTSELDMLETILEAKDKKISQIARSNSLDYEMRNQRYGKPAFVYSSDSDNKLEKPHERQRKKFPLRKSIGQALSFDFHDIESRKSKSPEQIKHKSFSLRKQKTFSRSYKERQSLCTLLNTSSLLRHRVLEDPKEVVTQSSDSINTGSSLPILLSNSLNVSKTSDVRKSLPTLCAKDKNFASECLATSLSSAEDIYHESDFKQSCDSVFEKFEKSRVNERVENQNLLDGKNTKSQSTSGLIRLTEGYSNNSLNNFIKSVGLKVKQVMAGEMTTIRNQVPTISQLCDEQSILNEVELCNTEDFPSATRTPKEESKTISEKDGSFDCSPKKDPPDL